MIADTEQEDVELERWLRSADDWHDALQKQSLCLHLKAQRHSGDKSDYFAWGAEACDYALELWHTELVRAAEEIERYERLIAKLLNTIRVNVGKQLEAESSNKGDGWIQIAHKLQDLDASPESLLNRQLE